MITLEALEALAHDAQAIELLGEISRSIDGHPLLPADIERWRRRAPAQVVAAAVEVAMARQSLRGRIAAADAYWADRSGAAQASDDASASWKAQRSVSAMHRLRTSGQLPDSGAPVLADYCCGTGADLAHFALALDGCVEGADLREERTWMALRNAHAPVHVADVRAWRSDAPLAHIDPSRRDEASGGRSHSWHALEPGPDILGQLIARHAGVMVKLGPGTDVPPEARPPGSELVYLSRDGALTQALLCTGVMAEPASGHACSASRAVLLRHGQAPIDCAGLATWTSGRGAPGWLPAPRWGRLIAEPDPSLERSGLLPQAAAALGLAEVHAGLGLCTNQTDGLDVNAVVGSPWWRAWEVVAVVPGRLEAVEVAARAHQPGIVDVKVRGGAAPADQWSAALRGRGSTPITVFVHRTRSGSTEAVLAKRRG